MFVLKMQKNQCLYTSQETQREHFYQYQITTRAFHHNRVLNYSESDSQSLF